MLLVPDPAKLDTRRPMSSDVRYDQLGQATADAFDDRLTAGTLGIGPGQDWTLVATVIGPYGISLGSYEHVAGGPLEAFTVAEHDTRALMIRQIWGARVLQGGRTLPGCEANDHWTFTLFVGERLIDGCAESGTVLQGKVRFRLGKPARGIGPARIAPNRSPTGCAMNTASLPTSPTACPPQSSPSPTTWVHSLDSEP